MTKDMPPQQEKHANWLTRLRTMPKDSKPRAFTIALILGLTAGILVTATSVLLKPTQIANQERAQQRILLEIIAREPGIKALIDTAAASQITPRIVELGTGSYLTHVRPESFDPAAALRDESQSVAIPPDQDVANIKRRAKHALVFQVTTKTSGNFVIVPIYGKGYASTLYGYLGIDAAENQVVGLNFYDHNETPGLGAQINDPAWLNQWRGKKIWDSEGTVRLGIALRSLTATNPSAEYTVDGISGATRTSRGVHRLMQYWLGDHGFGRYLKSLREHRAHTAPPSPP